MTNDSSGQPRFTVAVQAPRSTEQGGGSSFNLAAADYSFEREALDRIDAEIVENPRRDRRRVRRGRQARRRFDCRAVAASTPRIIAGLERAVVIGCGSVGTDTVDVDAATEAGIPGHECARRVHRRRSRITR